MLGVKRIELFIEEKHENRVEFPGEERNAFVLDHQHGRRVVTWKPAIGTLRSKDGDGSENIAEKVNSSSRQFQRTYFVKCRQTLRLNSQKFQFQKEI